MLQFKFWPCFRWQYTILNIDNINDHFEYENINPLDCLIIDIPGEDEAFNVDTEEIQNLLLYDEEDENEDIS